MINEETIRRNVALYNTYWRKMKRKKNPITRSSILQKLYEKELKKIDVIISAKETIDGLSMAAARLLGIYQSKKDGIFASNMMAVVGIICSSWFYNKISFILGKSSQEFPAGCFMGTTQRFEREKVREYMEALKIEDALNGTLKIAVEGGIVSCVSILRRENKEYDNTRESSVLEKSPEDFINDITVQVIRPNQR